MSMHRLDTRLAKLEAQRPAEAEPPYPLPELSDDYVAEVLCLLWHHGGFASVEEMCCACFGLTDPAVVADMAAEVARIVEGTETAGEAP